MDGFRTLADGQAVEYEPAEGRNGEAGGAWSRSVAVLEPFASSSTDPTVLSRWVGILEGAGEAERAAAVRSQLESMGVPSGIQSSNTSG